MPQSRIFRDFWFDRLTVNQSCAIFHQWQQLEGSGCIENFRIAAGKAAGFREGWFFADSDAYKWLEAASHILASNPNPQLTELADNFIALLSAAQMPDGYLFTYNQIFFPDSRWQNLKIEHELYCHGHLIEAGVSHFNATGRTNLLDIARRAADRIASDFSGKGAAFTPGHEEIEIALLRLHQITPEDTTYLNLAKQFIELRGHSRGFGLALLQESLRVGRREKAVKGKRQVYLAARPDYKPFQVPPGNGSKKAWNTVIRWYDNALTGKYFQQHRPVREQAVPVGHSVRFAYLETAIAMLARISGDISLIPILEQTWNHMVTRRMYITGGIGSLPGLEGFGRDFELDPEVAYAETCAALGCLFWNWEMVQLTGRARYSDLFEWQLYNAAAVGMGLEGTSYLYNNPLACRGNVVRQPWYAVPCCPSNLSRTLADLSRYIVSSNSRNLFLHQYISCELTEVIVPGEGGEEIRFSLEMDSALPWQENVRIRIMAVDLAKANAQKPVTLCLRQPTWAAGMSVSINGTTVVTAGAANAEKDPAASGFDPRPAVFLSVDHAWMPGDVVELHFEMPITMRRARPEVKGHKNKVAITRGPLVYCLEDVDNIGVNIFTDRLDPISLQPVLDGPLVEGMVSLQGETLAGKQLRFIPYFLWGNRGKSQMTVWVNH